MLYIIYTYVQVYSKFTKVSICLKMYNDETQKKNLYKSTVNFFSPPAQNKVEKITLNLKRKTPHIMKPLSTIILCCSPCKGKFWGQN